MCIYVPDMYTAFQSSTVCIVFELEGVRGSGIPPATIYAQCITSLPLRKGIVLQLPAYQTGFEYLALALKKTRASG